MDATPSAWYSGRVGKYDLRLHVYTIENNVAGNYSRYRGDLYAYSHVGWGSWVLDSRGWGVYIAGYSWSGSRNLDFRPDFAGKTIGFGSFDTGPVYHDGNGNLGFQVGASHANVGVFGTADTGRPWYSGDFLPKPPHTPNAPSVSGLGTVAMTLSWNIPYDGGSGIDQMLLRGSTDPNFATYTDYPNAGNVTSRTVSGLTPNTAYHWRVYAHNAQGYGPSSGVTSASTLPSTPPTQLVLPSLTGREARVTLQPPGGVSGVTEYNIERRLVGSTTVVATTSATSVKDITGLTPGAAYEWRSNAEIGSYTSPWTAWTPYVQPNPNTNPGDYFDTTTPPRADWSFIASGGGTTQAIGNEAMGWAVSFNSGGGTIPRVTGGLFGDYSARVIINRDTTTTSAVEAGVGPTLTQMCPVEADTVYTASMYVKPIGRAQRMGMMIRYHRADGSFIDGFYGPSVECPADVWTRLSHTRKSSANAVWAQPRAVDRAGTGHSLWLSGETFQVDGLMMTLGPDLLPYFDGAQVQEGFITAWEGEAHKSVSSRTPIPVALTATADLLTDPDCPPLPLPPLPPQIPSNCIDEVGTWRRYTLPIAAQEVTRWGATIPTLVLETGVQAERQVRIRYYANPNGIAPELVTVQDDWEAELILTYMPANSVFTLDGTTERVRAVVDGGPSQPANHLLYGTGGVPAVWPVLNCGIGYVLTFDTPLESDAGNLLSRVLLTPRQA